jgi:origin recognition complex subunit 4
MTKRSIEEVEQELEEICKIDPIGIIQKDTRHDIRKAHALLLARLNGVELPSKLHNLDEEYNTLYKLLKQTVTSGESNSCLLIGNRGTGKTALVRTVLRDLKKLEKEFCIVKLNGLTEINDKLALNEISRQLAIEQDQGERSFVNIYLIICRELNSLTKMIICIDFFCRFI